MNVLIVEDDVHFSGHLSKSLRNNEVVHRVDVAADLDVFMSIVPILEGYDIVLTDLRLSQIKNDPFDGFYVIRTIRDMQLRMPIIVISCRDDLMKIQSAFELGANDYMVKGMRMKELELRIVHWYKYFHLSKMNFENRIVYEYNELSYSLAKNEFYIEDQAIPLTKIGKKMLSVFFIHADTLVTEAYLTSKIWGDITTNLDRNIRIHISRLRITLAPFGIDEWIHTVHGEGYIFSKY